MEKEDNLDKYKEDHKKLLFGLKSTVEWLLANQGGIWKVYGGLPKLTNAVEKILKNGLRLQQGFTEGDFWPLISDQRWLHPKLADSVHCAEKAVLSDRHLRVRLVWVQLCLQAHNLSLMMRLVLSSEEDLHQYYHGYALLLQPKCVEVMVSCLRALEQNNPAFLNNLCPDLMSVSVKPKSPKRFIYRHQRSSSLPTTSYRRSSIDHLLTIKEQPSPVRKHCSGTVESEATNVLLSAYSHPKAPTDTRTYSFYPPRLYSDDFSSKIDTSLADAVSSDSVFVPESMSSRPSDQGDLMISSDSALHAASPLQNTLDGNGNASKNSDRLRYHSDSAISYASDIPSSENAGKEQFQSSATNSDFENTSSDVRHDLADQHTSHRFVPYVQNPSLVRMTRHLSLDDESAKQTVIREKTADDELLQTLCIFTASEQLSVQKTSTPTKETIKLQVEDNFVDQKSLAGDSPSHLATRKKLGHIRSMSDADLPFSPMVEISMQDTLTDRHHSYSYDSSAYYFPRPAQGQSLKSYLASQDFHTCSNLEKENAHFSICEALVAAIEHMKCKAVLEKHGREYEVADDSDEEIQELKQKIRIRRRQKFKERAFGFPTTLLSDGQTDTPPTTSSPAETSNSATVSFSSASESFSPSSSSDSVEEMFLDENGEQQQSNLSRLQQSGLSLSMASMYSDADLQKQSAFVGAASVEKLNATGSQESSSLSADTVAINLLRRFEDRKLPKASELEWLVSEQDAPQALLPLPLSWPVSPDESEQMDFSKRVRIRGNLEWAPPRAQVIFSIHPTQKRKVVMAKQNYRCAGCGAKIEASDIKRYRYCNYFGKYFCPCCHSNHQSFMPGRILQKWDFSKFGISHFALDLLKNISRNPLFNMQDINPALYRKVGALSKTLELRQKMPHFNNYIKTCRHAGSVNEEFSKRPPHLLDEIHVYSLDDLIEVKNGALISDLKSLAKLAQNHIYSCELCKAKAFICEICQNSDDFLFPFELKRVVQCKMCRSIFHKACFVPGECRKCARLKARQMLQEELEFTSSSSDEKP